MASNGFVRYICSCALKKFGRERYRKKVSDILFKYQCSKLRGKSKRLNEVMAEFGFSPIERKYIHPKRTLTTEESLYNKYRHFVKYLVFKLGPARFSIYSISDEDLAQEIWSIIFQKVNFDLPKHEILSYMSSIAKTHGQRVCARALPIKVPVYLFFTIFKANRRNKLEDSWEFLVAPRNRFVVPLEEDVPEVIEERGFRYGYLKGCLGELVSELSEKERVIVGLRFGPESYTFERIGEVLGCTKQYIQQTEEVIIRKLRVRLLESGVVDGVDKERLRRLPLPEIRSGSSERLVPSSTLNTKLSAYGCKKNNFAAVGG